MRRRAFFILACLCFSSIGTVAFGVDLETYSKRVGDTDGLKVALVEWRSALEQATSDNVDALVLVDLLVRFDRLWSGDNKFQRDVSKQLVERMKGIKQNTIADWQAALDAATDDAPSKVNTLLLLIQQDRVFAKSALVDRAERDFVARLKSLPTESVKDWATAVMEDRAVAAVQLASDDNLFNDGAFQAGVFQTLLENARRKRASSAPAPTAKPAYDAVANSSGVRTWTDSTGRHTVEAAFVSVADGRVTLKKKSGATVTLVVEKLSAADRDWLKKHGDAKPTTAESDSPPATPTKTKKDAGFATVPEGWPKRSGDLSGSDEVRVKNPNDFQVRVGLRSAGKGKDFVVPAGGVQSVKVPNGKYDIYFQYSTDPTGLYQGDSFTLADNGVEIQIVKVVNGNYGIRKVK